MKRPSPMLRQANEIDMNSTMPPMIDVAFLLLVFFVWTASFQIIEQILPTEMEAQMGSDSVDSAEPKPEEDFDDIVVRIGWDGQNPTWTINEQNIPSLDEVMAHLQTVAGVNQQAPVILHPDGPVPLGHVIDVYDVAKLSGFAKISFAVNPGQP